MLKQMFEQDSTYKLIYENHPDTICIIDVDGNYVLVNAAIEKLTGYTQEEFLNISPEDLFDGEHLEKRSRIFKRALEGEQERLEVSFRHKEGNVREAISTYIPIVRDHVVVGVYSFVQDVTALKVMQEKNLSEKKRMKKALLESEGQYRLISEYSMDLITRNTADDEKAFIYVSPSSHTLLGYSPEELMGTSAYDYYHPDEIQLHLNYMKE